MKRWFLWILKLSIAFGILYYLFTKISFSEVITSIVSAKISYVLIGLLMVFFARYLAAYRMKLLTDKQGMSLSLFQVFEISFITSFYGLFLPGYLTGGAIRLYKLSRPDNKWTEALASMVFDRLIDSIVLVMLGILFWVLDTKSNSNYIIGLSFSATLSGLLITYFLVFNGKVSYFLQKYKGKINFSFIPGVLQSRFSKLLFSTSQYHSLSRSLLIYILVLSLFRYLLGILSFYMFALSLGINLSFISVGWIGSLSLIIGMLPISFSGLGVREGTLVFLLQPYGITASDAVALSFLLFARTLLVGGVGGLFEAKNLFVPRRSKSEVVEKF
ncbi:MAG TPA: lysylphosphatidylglycerol synthase transmembrane domain-containing protein [Thermodesulfobacteriota bacterium]|nr:lysylphosphatidylglycerol synthase transmembrane domain-containing protein [Thermodesulfobacteriota bacterium]